MSRTDVMDGLRVKISEKYKPPPRINLPTSYSQRLTLNKQLIDSMPSYEFGLETTVKERLNEWRKVKRSAAEQKREKLERVKETRRKNDEEKESVANQNMTQVLRPNSYGNYSNYTNVLTPMPSEPKPSTEYVRSPINISDFEPETSTPFDNLELKTINDLEELKLVLENEERKTNSKPFYGYPVNMPTLQSQIVSPVSQVTQNTQVSQPSQAQTSNYMNGYATSYEYSKPVYEENAKTVPDVMQDLNNDLKKQNVKVTVAALTNITNDVNDTKEFDGLSKNLQDVCRGISSMGFPLERVARTCRDYGEDTKKIIDHLLALDELLDLGFHEEKIRSALIKCNNDKEKALEVLL